MTKNQNQIKDQYSDRFLNEPEVERLTFFMEYANEQVLYGIKKDDLTPLEHWKCSNPIL